MQRKAFFEPRQESKIRTRGSDIEKLNDHAIKEKVYLVNSVFKTSSGLREVKNSDRDGFSKRGTQKPTIG